jgi:hypothetical protein
LSAAAGDTDKAITMKELLSQAIVAAGSSGIAPEKDGRICEANQLKCNFGGR